MYPAKIIFNKRFSLADMQIEILSDSAGKFPMDYDQHVTELWQAKEELAKQTGIRLYDGIYYRVTNVSEIEETEKLILRLGNIPYRYIATASALEDFITQSSIEPTFHLSTGTMIRTAEGTYLFGQKSKNGRIDLIGGGAQKTNWKSSPERIYRRIFLRKLLKKQV